MSELQVGEALGYWFTQTGLGQGDFCLYVTKRSTKEVLKDAMAFGLDFSTRVPFWIAREGGEVKSEVSDLAGLSYNIKEVLKKNTDRRIRIVVDMISALLMLNAPESIYRFLGALFEDVKKYDAILLGMVEDGMHQTPSATMALPNP